MRAQRKRSRDIRFSLLFFFSSRRHHRLCLLRSERKGAEIWGFLLFLDSESTRKEKNRKLPVSFLPHDTSSCVFCLSISPIPLSPSPFSFPSSFLFFPPLDFDVFLLFFFLFFFSAVSTRLSSSSLQGV
ncbi:hypothetical protein F5X99DRAFT_234771 [Biscogniauxia marginata]|nr:hypothetical protein F5X99DRAFT_234771 [Biscogniauxia marginata]